MGKTDIVQEDLTGIVDLGTEVFNQNAVDNYVKSLVNHIGKVIFVNRPYAGKVPSVLMDAWEFGSVLEKIIADVPEAEENDTWNLTDKAECILKDCKASQNFLRGTHVLQVHFKVDQFGLEGKPVVGAARYNTLPVVNLFVYSYFIFTE